MQEVDGKKMQLKPIAAITVLLLVVASLSVAGCSVASDSKASTDYPTSGRSKLIEGAVEQMRSQSSSSDDYNSKTQAFTVNWISNTQAKTHKEVLETDTFRVRVTEYTFTHFPSTNDATTYYTSHAHYGYGSGSFSQWPFDYYKLTGKAPTVHNGNSDTFGVNGIGQYDALVVEQTYNEK